MSIFDKQLEQISQLTRAGDLRGARELCVRALEAAPANADFHNALGVLTARLENPAAARPYFAAALKHNPNHYGARQNLAELAVALGNIKAAIHEFEQLHKQHGDQPSKSRLEALRGLQRGAEIEKQLIEKARKARNAASYVELGNFYFSTNKLQEAERAYRKAHECEPRSFAPVYNLGNLNYMAKRYESAKPLLAKSLQLDPRSAQAHARMADTLMELGDLGLAETHAKKALALDPQFGHAHNTLGNIYNKQVRLEEAEANFRKAAECDPGNAVCFYNVAGVCEALGKVAETELALRQAIKVAPDFQPAWTGLSLLLCQQKRYKESVEVSEDAIARFPASGHAYFVYAEVISNLVIVDPERVIVYLRRATELEPNHLMAWLALAEAYRQIGDVELTEGAVTRALAIDPHSIDVQLKLATVHVDLGRTDEAIAIYRQLLARKPDSLGALQGIAMNTKFKGDEPELAALEALAAVSDNAEAKPGAFHALGKVYNDIGAWQKSVEAFKLGKKHRNWTFDLDEHNARYSALIGEIGEEFFASCKTSQSSDRRPVFIVGMPRCGSTLTEQILASHPGIAGLGEVANFRNIAREQGYLDLPPAELKRTLMGVTGEQLRVLSEKYAQVFARTGQPFERYIDKSLHNFELLWLVPLLFPNAAIIHCSRDPIDNCISIFQQNFTEFHSYSKDFATLGAYYRSYERLMAHWKKVLPIEIFESSYEDMVEDVEGNARRLIAHLGLEWDDRCLDFHKSERIVQTASRWQVRQGIYKSSQQRWKKFEPWIGELIEALGPENTSND